MWPGILGWSIQLVGIGGYTCYTGIRLQITCKLHVASQIDSTNQTTHTHVCINCSVCMHACILPMVGQVLQGLTDSASCMCCHIAHMAQPCTPMISKHMLQLSSPSCVCGFIHAHDNPHGAGPYRPTLMMHCDALHSPPHHPPTTPIAQTPVPVMHEESKYLSWII